MKNLELWKSVEETPTRFTKPTKVGQRKFTAICPQYQRMKATEVFGPYGQGWGVENELREYMDIGETKLCLYTAKFWYDRGDRRHTFPIQSSIKVAYKKTNGDYIVIDDDFMKKVATDALTKGLSYLGFNADIFMGMYDDNKYVRDLSLKEQADEIINGDTAESFLHMVDQEDARGLFVFVTELKANTGFGESTMELYSACVDKLYSIFPNGKKTEFKNRVPKLTEEGLYLISEDLKNAIRAGDPTGVDENWDELSQPAKKQVVNLLEPSEINYLKSRTETA